MPNRADISMAKLKYMCKKGTTIGPEVKKLPKLTAKEKQLWQKLDLNPAPQD